MSDLSEHDDMRGVLHGRLHEALGAELATLEIGATPVAAVMKGGGALRTRRRMTAVSGVAALAVLPVAAVAIFSGGSGRETAQAGVDHHSAATSGAAPATSASPTELFPSPTADIPSVPRQLSERPFTSPVANDAYTVVAGGTLGGQHWRLVRDVFVAPIYANPDIGGTNHFPMSHRGQAGTQTCDFTGLQWGDRPVGTLPDFDAGGGCNPAVDGDVERIGGPLMGMTQSGTPTRDLPVSYFFGRVDAAKVATVAVTIQGVSTSRQPISKVPGEKDGYYVIFVPPLTFQQEQSMVLTAYDANGHVAARVDISDRMAVKR